MTTLTDLMEHCKAVVKAQWKYIYGAKGTILSKEDIMKLQEEYGKDYVWDSDLNKAGQICCDCSGLISSKTKILRNSQGYFNSALERKSIDERNPSMRGWGVWRKGHIGIYDGENGYYAMDGSKNNAAHSPLSANNFTHIIKLCDIDYNK